MTSRRRLGLLLKRERGAQRFDARRLDQMTVEASVQRPRFVLFLTEAGHRNQASLQLVLGAQPRHDTVAIKLGQSDIDERNVRPATKDQLET